MVFRVNDIIVSVNGISTVNVTHGQAVDALKRAGNVVSLVRCVRFRAFNNRKNINKAPKQWSLNLDLSVIKQYSLSI